jgi:hypothetical protein
MRLALIVIVVVKHIKHVKAILLVDIIHVKTRLVDAQLIQNHLFRLRMQLVRQKRRILLIDVPEIVMERIWFSKKLVQNIEHVRRPHVVLLPAKVKLVAVKHIILAKINLVELVYIIHVKARPVGILRNK